MTDTPKIYGALLDILNDIGPITKRQVQSFKAFAIDDVYHELQPLFAKHRVIPLPWVESVEYVPTADGRAIDARVVIIYKFTAEDGSSESIRFAAEGRDYQDKATNKAVQQAIKYGMVQTFLIVTGETDPDAAVSPPASSAQGRGSSVVAAPAARPPWAGLARMLELGADEDLTWPAVCPWCAEAVVNQEGRKSKAGKPLPAWKCVNDLCGFPDRRKDDGSYWPWSSFEPDFFTATGGVQDLIEQHIGGGKQTPDVIDNISHSAVWLWKALGGIVADEDERRRLIQAAMESLSFEKESLTKAEADEVFAAVRDAWFVLHPDEAPF